MKLSGKVALISGAARGQGEAEARLFAREGAKVILGDVLDAEGARVAADIAEGGGDALYLHLDVTREDDWKNAVDAAVKRFGRLDILVNNAGITGNRWVTDAQGGRRQPTVEETSMETWDTIMNVNVKGVFLGTKYALPAMRKAGGGSIINISSVAGLKGSAGNPAYSTSKGAVRLFTKSTAVQYGKEGIRCNSIHPGPIDTPMIADSMADPARRKSAAELTALGRVGRPEEVATCLLFLASDDSSYVTGSELVVDGGWMAK